MACDCRPGYALYRFSILELASGAALSLVPSSVTNCDGSGRGPGTFLPATTDEVIESQNFAAHLTGLLSSLDPYGEACYDELSNVITVLIGPNALALLGESCDGGNLRVCTSDGLTPPGPLAVVAEVQPLTCCPTDGDCRCYPSKYLLKHAN